MSVRCFTWVLEHSPVTRPSELLVLLVLAEHAHDDGSQARPSVETIAWKARLNRRAVQGALRRLERSGAVERTSVSRGGRGRPSTYRVLMNRARPARLTAVNRAPDARLDAVNRASDDPKPRTAVHPNQKRTNNKAAASARDAAKAERTARRLAALQRFTLHYATSPPPPNSIRRWLDTQR